MALRAVLFDAADTLFHVRGSVGEIYAAVAARHGVLAPPHEIELRFRTAFRSMPPLAFPGVRDLELAAHERQWWRIVVARTFSGVTVPDLDGLFDELFERFALAESWRLFPDAWPTLAALRNRDLLLAIVSNFDGRLTAICRGLGVADAFDAIVMSGSVGWAKPDPRIFAAALERLAVSPDEALHVGDSASEDVAGAHAAGIPALHLQRQGMTDASNGLICDLRELLALFP
jgi:putative hydrolase of the HAD superfamily